MSNALPQYSSNHKYLGKDNYGKPRVEYISRIAAMTEEQLFEETSDKVYLSAWANNNPRSDYHWQVDACYDEWSHRGKPEQYTAAWEDAKEKAGH